MAQVTTRNGTCAKLPCNESNRFPLLRAYNCCLLGRFMQATAYMVTAWEAFAMQKQKAPEEVAVVMSDIQIYQAVQAEIDTPVTLSVLLDRSNRFQVCCSCSTTCLFSPFSGHLGVWDRS